MIFCVEDDAGIRGMMVYTLKASGFEAEGFEEGVSLFEALTSRKPKLILLDIMLPGEDGISILKRLKRDALTRDIPVIMATAKGTEYDKVTGLDLGADDYLCKPFGMMEMVSRVKAVLRRTDRKEEGEILQRGDISLNDAEHIVLVGAKKVDLTLKEYKLFEAPRQGLLAGRASFARLGRRIFRGNQNGRRTHRHTAHQARRRG